MKSLLTASAAILAVVCLGASAAQAGGHYHGHHHGTSGVSGYPQTSYYPQQSNYVTYPSYQSSYHPHQHQPTAVWHDTTHVDVTPGQWVYGPYGLTYRPPRRELHVDGHYDSVPSYGHHHHH